MAIEIVRIAVIRSGSDQSDPRGVIQDRKCQAESCFHHIKPGAVIAVPVGKIELDGIAVAGEDLHFGPLTTGCCDDVCICIAGIASDTLRSQCKYAICDGDRLQRRNLAPRGGIPTIVIGTLTGAIFYGGAFFNRDKVAGQVDYA